MTPGTTSRGFLILMTAAGLIVGCSTDTGDTGDTGQLASESIGETVVAAPTEPVAEEPPAEENPETQETPAVQEETCDWDSPALVTDPVHIDSQQEGDLKSVIIGAWQHTHIDDGQGFEAVNNDLRFIFPSAERMLYCQDVPGITDRAQNAIDISWQDTTIYFPGSGASYTVEFWNDDTMVWNNEVITSTYLLKRR